MSINYLNSDIGLFTYYIDDDLYNYLKTVKDFTYLVKNTVPTTESTMFFSKFDANKFHMTLNCSAPPTDVFINFLNKYFPLIIYNTTAQTNTTYTFYNNKNSFKTIKTISRTPLIYEDKTISGYNSSNEDGFIYGYSKRYSVSDPDGREGGFYIIAFNTSMTAFSMVYVAIYYTKGSKDIYLRPARLYNTAYNSLFINYFKNIKPDPTAPDPYNKGGNTGPSGGGGTFGGGNTIFGGNSDSIDVPPLPTASASSAGFITLFNPSLAQLNNLANYMWSDLFSLETFKKIFADPMDCILGLSIVPVKPASAGTSAVKIGNISTDVSMNKTSSQYVAVDCGTIDVKEYWGAYLDYAPYTQCEIYLPYVGTKQISVDDVMNKAVHVVYHVDILSGACNAYVKCGDSVLYTFVGQCSSSIPISGNDWTNVLNGAISVAGKIGLAMATGGATALMSGLGAASSIISSSKPNVERSGAMSSTGGLLGIQKPYLILTRPKQALPENQNKYTGYPSFITMALSDCTGYTEIDSVHLENMTCTDEEAQEIENLLKSGVIF